MAFNLFDFSKEVGPKISPFSSLNSQKAPQIRGATGGGMLPPTISGIQLPTTKPVEKPSMLSNIIPKASAGSSFDSSVLKQLQYDITKGATEDEVANSYPELGGNTQLIKELHYDISKGATEEEIKGAYPELFSTSTTQPVEEKTAKVEKPTQEARGITTPISGVGAGFVNPLVEISKFSERYLEPTNWFSSKEEVDKNVSKVEKQLTGLLQEEGAKDLPGFSTGKFAGEMAALSAMPTTAINGAIAKLTETYGPKLVPKAVIAVLKNNPVKLKAAQSFLSGIVPAVGYQAASEGDVSLGTTASLAALTPITNIVKSLPGINKLTGKSEILNAGKVADKQALMTPSGKIVSDKAELDAAARRIAGGSPEQAQKTIDAVSKIDVKGIDNGDKLFSSLQGRVEKMSKIQDNVLGFDKKLYKPENTEIVSAFKDEVRKVNPFVNALDDLSSPSVMEKLKAEDAVKVNYYAKKFVKEGLSKLEQNELARIYGKQFDTFKGATPVASKAGFENTRIGMKEVVRRDMTPVSKKIDKQISDAIATRDVVKEINNKVAEAKSKVKFNLGEQVGRFLANILHKGTLGVTRGLAREIGGSGEAREGVMTTLEISKQLTKDLATVKKLSALLDKATTKEEVMNIIKSFKGAVPSVVGGTITNK